MQSSLLMMLSVRMIPHTYHHSQADNTSASDSAPHASFANLDVPNDDLTPLEITSDDDGSDDNDGSEEPSESHADDKDTYPPVVDDDDCTSSNDDSPSSPSIFLLI